MCNFLHLQDPKDWENFDWDGDNDDGSDDDEEASPCSDMFHELSFGSRC